MEYDQISMDGEGPDRHRVRTRAAREFRAMFAEDWDRLLRDAYDEAFGAAPQQRSEYRQSPLVVPVLGSGVGQSRDSRPRLPVSPLLSLLDRRCSEHGGLLALCRHLAGRCDLTWEAWARLILRARSQGSLTELQAERLSVVLGSSFEDVWGKVS